MRPQVRLSLLEPLLSPLLVETVTMACSGLSLTRKPGLSVASVIMPLYPVPQLPKPQYHLGVNGIHLQRQAPYSLVGFSFLLVSLSGGERGAL